MRYARHALAVDSTCHGEGKQTHTSKLHAKNAKVLAGQEGRMNRDSWISVEDRLPEMYESVVMWATFKGDSGPSSSEGYLTPDGWDTVRGPYHKLVGDITHWQPLPEGPEVTK